MLRIELLAACLLLALLVTNPVSAQPSLVPSPAPAPAPAPNHVNLTDLFTVAGPFNTFLGYLIQTKVIDIFQNQANDTNQGITIFVPKDSAFSAIEKPSISSLTEDQLKSLLLYHSISTYHSLSDFANLSRSNPVTTFAGGQYTLNFTDAAGVIHVISSWSDPEISSSVYTTEPVAVYELNSVLFPKAIFGTAPLLALAPAPAPLPGVAPASDSTPPSTGNVGGSPNASVNNNSSSSYGFNVGFFTYLGLVSAAGLHMLL